MSVNTKDSNIRNNIVKDIVNQIKNDGAYWKEGFLKKRYCAIRYRSPMKIIKISAQP